MEAPFSAPVVERGVCSFVRSPSKHSLTPRLYLPHMAQIAELDVFELKMLAGLPEAVGGEVMRCFKESDLKSVGNKSGLLAGIMRRVAKSGAGAAEEAEPMQPTPGEESSRQRKAREAKELNDLLAEEGIAEADDDGVAGSYVQQLNLLTGVPRADDLLHFVL